MTTEFLQNSPVIWSEFSNRWLLDDYWIFYQYANKKIRWPLNSSNIDDQRILILDFCLNSSSTEFLWNLSIQKFRWLSNSSRLRWPQNSFEILQGFWSDIFLKIKWPRNSYEILQGFWSEFWLSAVV